MTCYAHQARCRDDIGGERRLSLDGNDRVLLARSPVRGARAVRYGRLRSTYPTRHGDRCSVRAMHRRGVRLRRVAVIRTADCGRRRSRSTTPRCSLRRSRGHSETHLVGRGSRHRSNGGPKRSRPRHRADHRVGDRQPHHVVHHLEPPSTQGRGASSERATLGAMTKRLLLNVSISR
jgi:hypothetical protein